MLQPEEIRSRFEPVDLRADTTGLDAGDRAAVTKLIEAAQTINRIFLAQKWNGNLALFEKLRHDTSEKGEVRRQTFWLNKGPWSDLHDHQAFLPDVPGRKPLGAGFYPEDLSRHEFEAWLNTLDAGKRREAEGFYSAIERDGSGLRSVPYSKFHSAELSRCASLLREAAGLTTNASLQRFLRSRADAFLSDDYYESDLAWMDVDAPLEITIGPYETYNDEMFGFKAAFEAYITIRDEAETERLRFFGDHMQELEDHLPLDPRYRNPNVAPHSPLRVVNQLFAAGDGDHGVKAAAYNLPNDERVITRKGSKRVMLKNVQEAKFRSVLLPIAQLVLTPAALSRVRFDSFFTHILAHEMGHGIGPQQIDLNGVASTPRQALKELYSPIEEAKADILGLYILRHFADRQYIELNEGELYSTYLASAFRTLRFGLNEAHGKGMAIQFNYLLDRGAIVRSAGGWDVDPAQFRSAVRDLAAEVLTVEAEGNYGGAKALLERLGVLRDEVRATLDSLASLPVDIDVRFATAEQFTASASLDAM